MKNIFTKALALFAFTFLSLGVFGQTFNYEEAAEGHNKALEALFSQPNLSDMTDAEMYEVLKNSASQQTGEKSLPSMVQLDQREAPYAELEFSDAVRQMKNLGAINAAQESILLDFEAIVDPYIESMDVAGLVAAIDEFKANRIDREGLLSDSQKEPLYGFIEVAKASAQFHGSQKGFFGSCCWKCIKKHWAGVLLRDGLGAAIAIINAALTGNPVTTGALILEAGRWSAKYLKRKCGCCF